LWKPALGTYGKGILMINNIEKLESKVLEAKKSKSKKKTCIVV
jgi:hypothetical protein